MYKRINRLNICLKPTLEPNTVPTECVPKQCVNVAIWEGNGFKEHELYSTMREGRLRWDGDILYPRPDPRGVFLSKNEFNFNGFAGSLGQGAAGGGPGAGRAGRDGGRAAGGAGAAAAGPGHRHRHRRAPPGTEPP